MMQSQQMSLSCVPCAKRKVRCDRLNPCSHCRRRRDACQYPVPLGAPWSASRKVSLERVQSQRIERLEQYIRSLGRDPDQVSQSVVPNPMTSVERLLPHEVHEEVNLGLKQSNKFEQDETSCTRSRGSRTNERASLVEHDEQTTYIEAPVWYSWSEAERPTTEPLKPSPERGCLGFCKTLMDPISTEDAASSYTSHPTAQQVPELWNRYLSNVHPMTKLFFDWEKAPLLQKAAESPQALSNSEHAFSTAVYFITILSLSDQECELIMGDSRPLLLDSLQSSVETALVAAGFIATSDLLVLQAFLLYLLAMRNRARPASWFSLMGIAVRIAQRIGLHRDGGRLGLPPIQAEEKRRVWWQMQYMEITISQIVGCLSLTLYADWDTKLPANLEDYDIHLGVDSLPPDRQGLTGMSHCLWRYHALYQQRTAGPSGLPPKDFAWTTSSQISRAEKDQYIEQFAKVLGEKFVQHCELLNPLHVSIQLGIRSFILAFKRVVRHPGVVNTKISEIPERDREDFLKNSIECLEYYILGETTQSISHFRWHNENYFQWPAFVHVIIEARHRAASPWASSLWVLIDRVCSVHPKLKDDLERSDVVAIGRLMVFAWQQRQEYLETVHQSEEKPRCVTKAEEELNVPVYNQDLLKPALASGRNNLMALDFDMIDWSAWEKDGYI